MTQDYIQDLVVLPDKAREMAHDYMNHIVDSRQHGVGIQSGLRTLDQHLNPLLPGQMRVIMGRPGNGKTALMMHFTRSAAAKRIAEGNSSIGPPVMVTAEMSVEELMLREISHNVPVDSIELERGIYDDWDKAHEAIDRIFATQPIVYIGHSLTGDRKRPRLSVENIWKAMEYIQDKLGVTPAMVSLDYAQRLKLDRVSRDRRTEVSEIVETTKDMSLAFAVPVNLGSQVGRQVDERRPPVPELSDAKETANLEETADSMLSVMRPSKYYAIDERIPGTSLDCVEELFFVNIIKQRQGISGKGVWVWFDMAISRIADLEVVRTELS